MGGLFAKNLKIGGRNGLLHADRELEGFSSCIALLLAVVGDENVALEREHALPVGIFRSR
jgi:hypothetical protein